ncbi:hypothetical protein GYMLUDRAFT_54928 [Collybiopsis luxurians FD-317 M1]|nr:hypothetical protein GYMLUDRAFT_54928 [Collybiopsis luxurians FD-317 M1]
MSSQSVYAEFSSLKSSFPGPPKEPIPPLPTRPYTDPVETKSLPPDLPPLTASVSDLSMLRTSSVDPRKARRRGANFGFRRDLKDGSPLIISTSLPVASSGEDALISPSLTPPGTFTSTDSDASSFSDLPFDFPQPPPINLRRMKSSPLFPSDRASSREVKRWGAVPALPTSGLTESWSARGSSGNLADLQTELDFSPPFESMSESYRGRIDGLTRQLESVIRQNTLDTTEPPSAPWAFYRDSDTLQEAPFDFPAASQSSLVLDKCSTGQHNHPRDCSEAVGLPTPFPSTNHVASVQAPLISRQMHKMRSLKFAPECSSSLDRLEITLENPNPRPSKLLFRGRSISMDFHSSPSHQQYYHPNANRACVHRVPTAPLVKNCSMLPMASRERNVSLSTPFLHRPADNIIRPLPRSCHLHQSLNGPSPGLKSFIDITPEQGNSKRSLGNRDKMKRFLNRASQIFDWRKKKTIPCV